MLRTPSGLLWILILFGALTGCGQDANRKEVNVVPVLVRPDIAQTPKWMKRKCVLLRPLKERPFNQKETVKNWAKDIALYNTCASRHNSHVAWQAKRDKALAGK